MKLGLCAVMAETPDDQISGKGAVIFAGTSCRSEDTEVRLNCFSVGQYTIPTAYLSLSFVCAPAFWHCPPTLLGPDGVPP